MNSKGCQWRPPLRVPRGREPRPDGVDLPGVIPVKFDVTDAAAVAEAALRCNDVTLLVNNQGLRMKDAGEDLLYVSVIPCGH
jgi:hypothetical protein